MIKYYLNDLAAEVLRLDKNLEASTMEGLLSGVVDFVPLKITGFIFYELISRNSIGKYKMVFYKI